MKVCIFVVASKLFNLIIIDDILVTDDLLEVHFLCDLAKCKGACCWEGDFGAPLSESERQIVQDIYPKVKKYLSAASIQRIEESGLETYYKEPDFFGTTLLNDGSCVFLIKDANGIAKCGIERTWEEGEIDFQKPISCHLYPVRAIENQASGFSALNYDTWEICSAACSLGQKMSLPLYQFVKNALVRKYGESFYEQLDGYYRSQKEEA